mgnify:CR=1 FL=1
MLVLDHEADQVASALDAQFFLDAAQRVGDAHRRHEPGDALLTGRVRVRERIAEGVEVAVNGPRIFLLRVRRIRREETARRGVVEARPQEDEARHGVVPLARVPVFKGLARGARPQSMLWASTGTKNPAYPDLMYVEPLIGPETVNTLPDATLAAFVDHGQVIGNSIGAEVEASAAHIAALGKLGIDLDVLGERLQQEGLAQFASAFGKLLELTA